MDSSILFCLSSSSPSSLLLLVMLSAFSLVGWLVGCTWSEISRSFARSKEEKKGFSEILQQFFNSSKEKRTTEADYIRNINENISAWGIIIIMKNVKEDSDSVVDDGDGSSN